MRFYGGLSPSALDRLAPRRKQALWLAIDVLEAQENLDLIKAFNYSNMKESDRQSFDSKLKTAAFPYHIYTPVTEGAVDLKNSVLATLQGRSSVK